jgi:hypothetical protein
MQAEQKVTFTDEREAVARTIQAYVDGGKSGKGDDMKPAFHEGATIYGYVGQDLFGGPIQLLFDWNDGNGPATELRSQITNIDIEGTIAVARVELNNWTGSQIHRHVYAAENVRPVEDHQQSLLPPSMRHKLPAVTQTVSSRASAEATTIRTAN